MTNRLEDEIQRMVVDMDDQHGGQEQDIPETTEQETQPIDTIHIHYFPDAIVILNEQENTAQVVDSAPVTSSENVIPASIRDVCVLPLPYILLYRVSSVLYLQPAYCNGQYHSQNADRQLLLAHCNLADSYNHSPFPNPLQSRPQAKDTRARKRQQGISRFTMVCLLPKLFKPEQY